MFGNESLVFTLAENFYIAQHRAVDNLATMIFDKLIAQHIALQRIYFRLANHLVVKRIIEVTALRNDMFYLIGRSKELGKGDRLACIG